MKFSKIVLVSLSSILLAGCLPQISNSPQAQQESVKQAEKIADILTSGGEAVCTITDLTDSTKTLTMMISGKKIRFSGASMGSDGKTVGNFINDSAYTYIWEDGKKEGFKMKNPTEEEIQKMSEEAKKNTEQYQSDKYVNEYDDSSKYKLDCKQQAVDGAQFMPPSDVKFTDFGAMMQDAIQKMPKLPSGMPSIPANIPGYPSN